MAALVARIDAEGGRLDVLVNDIWGAEHLIEWEAPLWTYPLDKGLRMLRLAIDTHLITSHYALPLLIRNPGGLVVEMTDGTAEYNGSHYRAPLFYDLAKTTIIRLAWDQAQELKPYHCTAVVLTPGWLRSEMMLDHFGVAEANWRDAIATDPHFAISETPRYVGRAVAGPGCRCRRGPFQRRIALQRRAGPDLWLHRSRRLAAGLLALPARGAGAGQAGGRDRISLSVALGPLPPFPCGRAENTPIYRRSEAMREPPRLTEADIRAALRAYAGLDVAALTFLPLGDDSGSQRIAWMPPMERPTLSRCAVAAI